MDRLLARIAEGAPPLRVSEVASMTGYSVRFVRKLIEAGTLATVCPPGGSERRVPVQEARKLAAALRLLE
jgi:excisionase family DNA binding protein